uniref:P23 n=1 Tax=croton golden spot associated virus C TaxID=3072822 RepID=A0AA51RBC3_9CLOS|nr:p23 [croton golden spot associated virus C]
MESLTASFAQLSLYETVDLNWHKMMIMRLTTIMCAIDGLVQGHRLRELNLIKACIDELISTTTNKVVDINLLSVGHHFTKNFTESSTLMKLCFHKEHDVGDLLDDLQILQIFFEGYSEMLCFGRILPEITDIVEWYELPGSSMLLAEYDNYTFIFDRDFEEEAHHNNNVFVKDGILKLQAPPLKSEFFAKFNNLIFN